MIHFDETYCLIIAEAGINHNGNLDLALSMIDEAAKCNADIIKFQTISKETNFNFAVVDNNLYPSIEKACFSYEDYQILKQKAHESGIMFMSSAADVPAARLLRKLDVPGLKISSGNFTNFHLLSEVIKYDLPLILSSGLSDISEIDQTYTYLTDSGFSNFSFLYCVSEYPTDLERLDFEFMIKMMARYNVPVGFSDHSLGIIASVVARSLGACLIEKHFTLDKNLDGPDQHFAIDPIELRELVCQIRNVEKILFSTKSISTDFSKNHLRRSIYANRDLKKGDRICFDDIAAKRPYDAQGLDPRDFEQVLGSVALTDVKREQLIRKKDDQI